MTVKPIALISAANDPITKALPKVIALITFVMSVVVNDIVGGDILNAAQPRPS